MIIWFPLYCIDDYLHKAKLNYPINELEGTTAHYCLTVLSYYVLGNSFKTISYRDHLSLVAIINEASPQAFKHIRWINDFSQYNVEICYQPGKLNKLADALPRMSLKEETEKGSDHIWRRLY